MVHANATCGIVALCFFATSSILREHLDEPVRRDHTLGLKIPLHDLWPARLHVQVGARLQEMISCSPSTVFAPNGTSDCASGKWTPGNRADAKML